MPRLVRVAVVQSESDAEDPSENLAEVAAFVERLKDRDLIVFPELALHGHHLAASPPGELRRALRAMPAEDVAALRELVRTSRARVVLGELVEEAGRLFNLATYTDGAARVSYAKTHVHWSEAFAPGHDFPVADTPIGRIGMLICFDAAFPEVSRILTLGGAEMIVNISAIPDHFPISMVHRRLVACSVFNQVYTIFANRRGDGFRGGSAVVDPLGEIVAVAGEDDEVLEAEIDLDLVHEWRTREPLLPYRRPELYAPIASTPSPLAGHVERPVEPTTPK